MSRSTAADSVGSLLAEIANFLVDGVRILSLSDRRHWGPDEHEQLRALEDALDEAKKDFQGLAPLVNGQSHYENDRSHDSLVALRQLRNNFSAHIGCLKDWSRLGGPIDPAWVRDTQALQRDLHRAQYRAAGRIFASGQESSTRCLGAFLVYRQQRAWRNRQELSVEEGGYQRRHLEELRVCNNVGGFHRHGEEDIAFICDFCDGHLIWEDLDKMPSVRTAHDNSIWTSSPTATTLPLANPPPANQPSPSASPSPVPPAQRPGQPQWQATGFSKSQYEQKQVVFAPVAIANHSMPMGGGWQSFITCPFCEDDADGPRDTDDEEDVWRPEGLFEDVASFQEHLEWQHPALSAATPAESTCLVM
ncbi:unnamed protein product [Clonostachys byssicola]|uniref:Uncharacterized protein n=1 Tax=Clonostachys byssicola TaxID=160290 RepID=A0A9N9UXK3_9HYPO|nr:unnamed protein product [Clonostachys byssicola]